MSVARVAAGAQPTPETVSPADVGQIAAANGVPPSLAEAIGYQESGFNNDLVSTHRRDRRDADRARHLELHRAQPGPAVRRCRPTSALDNVRGGVLLLRSLLDQTGGNASLAAAGYYQGLQSVRALRVVPATRSGTSTT